MEKEYNMTINRLPAKTWNWLRMNETQLEKIEVPTDILHPDLYKQLIAWRNTEAAKAGLPVYTVIQQKAILGIVNLLPRDIASLVRIPYFGKKGAEKYGAVSYTHLTLPTT